MRRPDDWDRVIYNDEPMPTDPYRLERMMTPPGKAHHPMQGHGWWRLHFLPAVGRFLFILAFLAGCALLLAMCG